MWIQSLLVDIQTQQSPSNIDLNFLCPADKKRFESISNKKARMIFFTGRKSVHQLVIQQTQGDKNTLKINLGPHGKPLLENSLLHFSISHSADKVLVCLSDWEIGVDLDQISRFEDKIKLARKILHSNELKHYSCLKNTDTKTQSLASSWTTKEALTKCIGTGFSQSFSSVDLCNSSTKEFKLKLNDETLSSLFSIHTSKQKTYYYQNLSTLLVPPDSFLGSIALTEPVHDS